jgi:hypothetical protein
MFQLQLDPGYIQVILIACGQILRKIYDLQKKNVSRGTGFFSTRGMQI